MVDKSNPVPLYYQLKLELRERIERGEWKPGDRLPSEWELCRLYQLSRMTVRQALLELVNEGWLRRERGRGTFVSKPKIRKPLARLTSFTEDMRARGKRPSSRVLRLEIITAPVRIAEALRIPMGHSVVLIERVRLADGEPMGIECCYLSFEGCEAILQEDLHGSLYELLTREYGQIPMRAEEQLEAALCPPREAKLLNIPRGAPVLRIKRVTFNQDDHPIEYVESVYRGDRYVFYVELRADREGSSS